MPVEIFDNEPGAFAPDAPGKLKRDEISEADEPDELDDVLENIESRVCVTAFSAARTSCAAWALVVAEVGEELELSSPAEL